MPKRYRSEEHELTGEYEHSIEPRHGAHRAGSPGGTCSRFPSRHFMVEDASCGADNLEIDGFNTFTHARCPWASTAPCRCGRHSLHIDSLIVAVDGACPGNGTPHATKSAGGVFFARGSPENLAFRVADKPGYPHTSQRAELSAAIVAIKISEKYVYNGGQWDCEDCPTPCAVAHLVIKSDSAYLVNGMTAHVEKWRQNGWRTAKGTEVKNRDLWTKLDNRVCSLYDDTGVAIDFWLVPRDQNREADNLANFGLEIPGK
ncbi:ribonuclease H-like protein [Xylaria grammica]|nr:ribonuclease H-like protein [Xylaria grammica]